MTADCQAGSIDSKVRVYGYLSLVLVFALLAAFRCTLNAQQANENIISELNELIAESYGPDQHLVNGIEYINLHIRTTGHKFLDEDEFYKGRVVIDGKVYKDVLLKYDIYNQQVLLLIDHHSGGNKQLILNNLRIDDFEINGRVFHKYTFPNSGTLFYQVIGNNEMACLYHFRKQEIPRAIDQYTLAEFTDVQKRSYLYWQSGLFAFRSNRSFVKIFPEHQSQIKSFIRQNKFQVKKLNDAQMEWLISYCNSLTNTLMEDQ